MGTILCFTGDRNKKGKHDFSGAFDPECKAFMKLHYIPESQRLKVNTGYSAPHRAAEVIKFIEDNLQADFSASLNIPGYVEETATLAFFCHGLQNSIELGFNRQQSSVDSLSKALRTALGPSAKAVLIILYACSTAKGPGPGGDNGFSDRLRDSLCRHGFVNARVVGHTTAGHAVKNPYVRFFEGLGSPVGGTGGIYVVAPGSRPLWRKWISALKTDYRFRFPFKTIAEIHTHLLAGI